MMQSSARAVSAWPRTFDAHCHLHDPRLQPFLGDVVKRAIARNVTRAVTCACYENDWDALDALVKTGSSSSLVNGTGTEFKTTPSFGLHPWWADAKSDGYLANLRAKLMDHPHASVSRVLVPLKMTHLGEIGLCKSARGRLVDRVVQERVFTDQLLLATEMRRTCVIHCVGEYGNLLKILQTVKKSHGLPPVLILHSFGGAPEMISAFRALEKKPEHTTKVYFSLNTKQLSIPGIGGDRKATKGELCCAQVPLDALLLETDSPDQPPDASSFKAMEMQPTMGEDGIALNEPALLQLALSNAAAIRQVPMEELAATVYGNCLAAFQESDEECEGKTR